MAASPPDSLSRAQPHCHTEAREKASTDKRPSVANTPTGMALPRATERSSLSSISRPNPMHNTMPPLATTWRPEKTMSGDTGRPSAGSAFFCPEATLCITFSTKV